MARQHHYRRPTVQPTELDMTTFLNLMVVLVPFLLITAVFSRITIVELDMPSATGGASAEEPGFRIEVIVRDEGLELTNGRSVIAAIPMTEEGYDLATLRQMAISLKRDHPEASDASVLLEPEIEYDHLIQVMDAIRSTPLADVGIEPPAAAEAADAEEEPTGSMRVALFTNISIGDAP
jgi:biopolymer transport protein ExbD